MRTEFSLIAAGFDLLPTLSSNNSKIIAVNSGASALEAITTTGTGSGVRATSPTLVTPILGTPTSGTLTNCTGLPVSSGISGLGSGVATFLATPSSANLKTAVTDETGSGLLVFATDPVLTTPNIGTPSAGTLTNCTGLPIAGIASLGAGVGSWLAVASSANLFTAMTTKTGSGGSLVFATGPTLTSPTLGAATATTINLLTITQPASGATLTIADGKTFTCNQTLTLTGTSGKTLTVSHSLTLAGTDATVMTFPSTSATIARTDTGQTFTGTNAFGTLTATTVNGNTITTGTGTLTIAAGKTLTANASITITGTDAKTLTLSNSLTLAGTDATVMTFPTTSATIARTDTGQTFTGTNAFGTLTATTVNGNTITTGTGVLTLGAGKTLTTSATLTLAGTDGKTLTVSKSLTLDGTDSTVMTFPSTTATIARTDAGQTFTGIQLIGAQPASWQGAATGHASSVAGADSPAGNGGNFRVLTSTTQAVDVGGSMAFGGYYIGTSNSIDFASAAGRKENSTSGQTGGYFAIGTRANGGNLTDKIFVTSDGRLYGNALHNNAGAVTGTTNQYIASGTYTPTITNGTNVAASTARVTQWMRVGNVVTVAGRCDIDVTSDATNTIFDLSLPIPSTFALASDAGGAGTFFGGAVVGVHVQANTATATVRMNFTASGTPNNTASFSFTYVVL